jgi:hypothetical protein
MLAPFFLSFFFFFYLCARSRESFHCDGCGALAGDLKSRTKLVGRSWTVLQWFRESLGEAQLRSG